MKFSKHSQFLEEIW